MSQQVGPGDRLTIHGLKGRPELNGQSAVLVGPAGAGRVTVKLDSGEQIALKQDNLGIQAPGGDGGGGGMPGMPGGMPGMPAGMPDPAAMQAMLDQTIESVRKTLASVGIRLPASTTPGQLVGGIALATILAFYLLTRIFSMAEFLLVGLAAYWGIMTDSGRSTLARCSAKVSSIVRRPVSPRAALLALCVIVAVAGHMFLGGSGSVVGSAAASSGASAHDASMAHAIREAYDQGYDDGVAGTDRRPPKYITSPDRA